MSRNDYVLVLDEGRQTCNYKGRQKTGRQIDRQTDRQTDNHIIPIQAQNTQHSTSFYSINTFSLPKHKNILTASISPHTSPPLLIPTQEPVEASLYLPFTRHSLTCHPSHLHGRALVGHLGEPHNVTEINGDGGESLGRHRLVYPELLRHTTRQHLVK